MPCIMGAGEAKGRGEEARSAIRKQQANRGNQAPIFTSYRGCSAISQFRLKLTPTLLRDAFPNLFAKFKARVPLQ